MSNVWLKCDHCNKELKAEADCDMQLTIRFKPSLFRQSLGQTHPLEQRHRCRSCGWVNVFIPVEVESSAVLTGPRWDDIVTK